MSKGTAHRLMVLFVLLIGGCDKDSENGPRPRERHFDLKNECKNFTTTSSFGFERYQTGVQYDQPRFNPHDADELVYHEYSYSEDFSRLVKYRLSSGEKTVFLDPAPGNIEIDWGRGGWIAFSNYVDVYLMREEGGAVYKVPLTSEGHSCAEPDWNPDGTVVGFPFGGVDGISLYGEYLLYDIVANSLDTFDLYNSTRPLAWSSRNNLSFSFREEGDKESDGLGYIDMNSFEQFLIFKHNDRRWWENQGSGDITWNSKGDKEYLTGGGIVCFSLNEYKEIRIKKGCMSRYYEDITISPDDKQIVVERVNATRSGNILDEKHVLYIMDIDGCNERPLFDD